MKEEDDSLVSWTEGGQRVRYSWARLSADSRRRVWGLLDARGREDAREKLGGTWTGRKWLRANDTPGLVARDKSVIAAADKRAQEERLRAGKAKEEEQLRAELKPRLLEEIRAEWADEKQRLEDELRARSSEVDRLRAESKRAADEFADLAKLRSWVGRGEELAKQILDQRGQVDALEAEKKRILSEIQRLKWNAEEVKTQLSSELEAARKQHGRELDSYDRARRELALRRADRFLWDAAPVELVEHLSFLVPDARTDGAIAVLIHRGMAPSDIAKSLRVSRERVMAVLEGDGKRESVLNETREWMGPAPDGYYSGGELTGAELVAKVQELRGSGASEREIARVTGAPLSRVRRILRQEPPAETEKGQPTAPPAAGSE